MKRFLTFLIAAAALVAGGCSDSDTDDNTPPEAPAPVIKLPSSVASTSISVSPEGGTSQIEYEIENPVEGETIVASTPDAWVHSFDYSKEGEVGFTVDPSKGETRIANITLNYKGAEKKVVTVMQPAPEVAQLTFDIKVLATDGSSAVVKWTPSDNEASYLPLVVEKSLFDSYPTEAEYIQSDIEYIQGMADRYNMSFLEMLSEFLTKGPTAEEPIDNLSSDTDYYAYAYGMTAEGVATSAISKTEFRTGPFSCEFTIAHEETDSTCDVEVTPSNTGCFYYFDMAEKANFDTWGDDAAITAGIIADLQSDVAYYQSQGYDITLADLLSVGPDDYSFTGLTPDTDYVIYAFALTEEGKPLTGVTREPMHTKAFVTTDDCTFDISFSNVAQSDFDITVKPSKTTTRYYIGICSKELYDESSPAAIANAFIEMENGYKIDWAGDDFIWSGEVTVNSDSDLYTDMDPGTDYVAVVFGVDTEGVRTTEVASAVQKTAAIIPSDMTIGITVRNVTATGAFFDVTPSKNDEVYFADPFLYDEYSEYKEGKTAYAQAMISLYKYYGFLSDCLFTGNQTIDYSGMLEASTKYVVVAFGYSGGLTTPLFESEPFTTPAAAPTSVKAVRNRNAKGRIGNLQAGLDASRPAKKTGLLESASKEAFTARQTISRFSSVGSFREFRPEASRSRMLRQAELRLRRY